MIGRSLLVGTLGLLAAACSQAASGQDEVGTTSQALHENDNDDRHDDFDNPVFTWEHDVTVSHGATLHVIEKFSKASISSEHRRGVVALTGTLVTCDQYNADVPGFNVMERLAKHGYFAFCATYEGYGQSSKPADGKDVTAPRLLDEMGDIVEWARHLRHIGRVDLFGASLGSSLAFKLGGVGSPIESRHVRRVVLTANVYRSFTPQVAAAFAPLFAFFHVVPNGYFTTDASFYLPLVGAAPAPLINWVSAHFPGTYAVGPTLAGEVLPPFLAADGRAPALQILGDQDPITPLSDALQFQSEYGGTYELFHLTGSGHSPYFSASREQFWVKVFNFLDSNGRHDGCDSDDE